MLPKNKEMREALEKRHGKEYQEKISKATAAICGLGGLGSAVAACLARTGIGKLILIDFDTVDISNLNRQQYKANQVGEKKTKALAENIKEIAPYVSVQGHCVKISESNAYALLKDADVVCEAFDDAQEKAMLVNFVLENMPDKYIIASSGIAGMGSPNGIKTKKIMKNFYLCGDGKSEDNGESRIFAPRVMLCAAHEACAALKIIMEK